VSFTQKEKMRPASFSIFRAKADASGLIFPLLEPLELSDEVGPAELMHDILLAAHVSRVVVGGGEPDLCLP
jgi:hypothetical protein